jgi:hypothetical protein
VGWFQAWQGCGRLQHLLLKTLSWRSARSEKSLRYTCRLRPRVDPPAAAKRLRNNLGRLTWLTLSSRSKPVSTYSCPGVDHMGQLRQSPADPSRPPKHPGLQPSGRRLTCFQRASLQLSSLSRWTSGLRGALRGSLLGPRLRLPSWLNKRNILVESNMQRPRLVAQSTRSTRCSGRSFQHNDTRDFSRISLSAGRNMSTILLVPLDPLGDSPHPHARTSASSIRSLFHHVLQQYYHCSC